MPPPSESDPKPPRVTPPQRLLGNLTNKARGLADTLDMLSERAAGTLQAAAQSAAQSVGEALPDAKTVRHGMGRALILGGRTLADPRAVVGEFAMGLGQRLTQDARTQDWLALAVDGEGFVVLGRGDEEPVRQAAAAAVAEGRAVLVCKVVGAHDPTAPA